MKECLLYKKIDENQVQCQTCSHYCKISNGKVGICGIRKNIDGKLFLLTYGKAAAAHIDPIEKKPLFHFLPGSSSFSFGTLGCNLRCSNCHNYDISQMFDKKGHMQEYQDLPWGVDITPKQIVQEAKTLKCQSISYTYNEPTIFLEFALDTMKLAKKSGLKNVWVTNGFMSKETLAAVMPYVDAMNVDIKSFNDEFYQKNCGAHVQPILDNCIALAQGKIWLEITTLVIPTLSDDKNMLVKIARFIKDKLGDFVPWHLSAFSGDISWKLSHVPDTPLEAIKAAYDIGKTAGLKYVYSGNVWEKNSESTYCPKCGKLFIERMGYNISRYDNTGACRNCGTRINGIF